MRSLFRVLEVFLLSLCFCASGFLVHQRSRTSTSKKPIHCKKELPRLEFDESRISSQALPLFPLRKSVKLPTENLTLNLYEDRYLAMAEYILREQNETRFFGAVHAGSSPHVVKGGVGPIVPLIRKGDVGVCFLVRSFEDSLIPTVGSSRRRRIRLYSLGLLRFHVQRVLDNGFGQVKGKRNNSSLPFILAEVELFSDRENISNSDSASEFDRLAKSLTYPSLDAALMRLYDAHNSIASLTHRFECGEMYLEYLSFALASKRISEENYHARFRLLHLTDSLERLKDVLVSASARNATDINQIK